MKLKPKLIMDLNAGERGIHKWKRKLGEGSIFLKSVFFSRRIASIIRQKISRTSSVFYPSSLGRHHWGLLITVLSLFHMPEAYISVSVNGVCKPNGIKSLKISPEAAFTLGLDAPNSIHSNCRFDLTAPETHSISLLFVRRKHTTGKKTDSTGNNRASKCPLVVSFPLLRPEEVKMSLDLCSEEAFKSVEHYTDLLPPSVTLEWMPTVKDANEILASEIVIAAVGRGREICSQPNQFFCKSLGYPVYCISKELVCDGKRNCPFEGRDEDKEMCSSGESFDKLRFGLGDATHISRGWEFLASEFIKKLTSKEGLGNTKRTDLSSSTEKSTILWADDQSIRTRDSESLPDVLKHYGPWGYLMLGMLICGTVLMFCGLWECCCRRPKSIASNAVGPALLIINQGAAQQNEMETPSTPGPPRYEELDQPPSYSTLFPAAKSGCTTSTAHSLPITIPLVSSLSNLLINNSSSQLNSLSNTQIVASSNLFPNEVRNSNCLEFSNEPETRPK